MCKGVQATGPLRGPRPSHPRPSSPPGEKVGFHGNMCPGGTGQPCLALPLGDEAEYETEGSGRLLGGLSSDAESN